MARGGAHGPRPVACRWGADGGAAAAPPAGAERALRGTVVSAGFVSLVGAGPGDPDLLTRRAAARLAEADLVLYDALVPAAVLDFAPRAQRFYVGKRAS